MFKIRKNVMIAIVIIMNAFLSCLEAIQIKTEFYTADNIPIKFQEFCDGGNLTILTLEGWPKNSTISVSEKHITGETKIGGSIKPVEAYDPMQLISSRGYLPGVPVTYTFTDSNKSIKEEITIIPNRLFAKSSSDNAQIEAKLILFKPANYSIVFEGFGENEQLILRSTSYDEVLEDKIPCKIRSMMLMPGIINKRGGIGRLSFTRPSGEVIKLELPWGIEFLKYIQYYDDQEGTAKLLIENSEFLKKNPKIIKYFNSKR